MQWLCVLRLASGWAWATVLIVVGRHLLSHGAAAVSLPLAVAAISAAMLVAWAMVCNPLCPHRARFLTRTVELVTAGVFLGSVAWTIWLVSTR